MLEQGNPELNIGDPGVKRQRKALGNPDFDFSETREGVRRIQNDSKENSKILYLKNKELVLKVVFQIITRA